MKKLNLAFVLLGLGVSSTGGMAHPIVLNFAKNSVCQSWIGYAKMANPQFSVTLFANQIVHIETENNYDVTAPKPYYKITPKEFSTKSVGDYIFTINAKKGAKVAFKVCVIGF